MSSNDPALITGRLNVNDYVAARKVDIQRLEELINNAGSNQKKRAFQSLPRIERRRAASHDPKRVPRKNGLRKQANFESLRDNAKQRKVRARPLPKTPKNRTNNPTDHSLNGQRVDFKELHKESGCSYSNRQMDKIWLPTHIWHKKRAFMTNIAGFVVPETATQKQYRKTYRLTNYIDEHGSIAWDTSFYGTMIVRGPALEKHLGEKFPSSTNTFYRNGAKYWQGVLDDIGPLIIHWFEDMAVAVHCHPSIFDDLWNTLSLDGLELEDCRFAIGSIDIAGKSSLDVISNLLSGVQLTTGNLDTIWDRSKPYGALPTKGIMNFLVTDPRLHHHTNGKFRKANLSASKTYTGQNSVYSKECRLQSLKHQLNQSEVDKLRQLDTRGKSKLEVSNYENFVQIPVTAFALQDGRIRLMLPWSWVLPFWLTIFCRRHVTIGGQLELQQLSFNTNTPFFPRDFPETKSGTAYNLEIASASESLYNRKPKSKRINYSNEIGNPFMLADFTVLPEKGKLQHILLNVLSRGVPQPGARIFRLPHEYINQREKVPAKVLIKENLIGFVTSGNYLFSSAKGAGIGVINDDIATIKLCIIKNPGSSEGFLASVKSANHNISL